MVMADQESKTPCLSVSQTVIASPRLSLLVLHIESLPVAVQPRSDAFRHYDFILELAAHRGTATKLIYAPYGNGQPSTYQRLLAPPMSYTPPWPNLDCNDGSREDPLGTQFINIFLVVAVWVFFILSSFLFLVCIWLGKTHLVLLLGSTTRSLIWQGSQDHIFLFG